MNTWNGILSFMFMLHKDLQLIRVWCVLLHEHCPFLWFLLRANFCSISLGSTSQVPQSSSLKSIWSECNTSTADLYLLKNQICCVLKYLKSTKFHPVLPKQCEKFFDLKSECGPRKNETLTTESALVISFPFRDGKCWDLGVFWQNPVVVPLDVEWGLFKSASTFVRKIYFERTVPANPVNGPLESCV